MTFLLPTCLLLACRIAAFLLPACLVAASLVLVDLVDASFLPTSVVVISPALLDLVQTFLVTSPAPTSPVGSWFDRLLEFVDCK